MKSGASATMTAEQSRSGIRSHVALGVLVLAIILIHAAGLRTGHEWSDDYAMYLSHALNLLSGQAYGDTGYIPNPWAVPGPATYPPVYPLLIMPWVAWWGTDLQMLKLFGLLMLAASKGTTIDVRTSGNDAAKLADALEALVANRFGEEH